MSLPNQLETSSETGIVRILHCSNHLIEMSHRDGNLSMHDHSRTTISCDGGRTLKRPPEHDCIWLRVVEPPQGLSPGVGCSCAGMLPTLVTSEPCCYQSIRKVSGNVNPVVGLPRIASKRAVPGRQATGSSSRSRPAPQVDSCHLMRPTCASSTTRLRPIRKLVPATTSPLVQAFLLSSTTAGSEISPQIALLSFPLSRPRCPFFESASPKRHIVCFVCQVTGL